jgi:hypothetical protein
MSAAAAAKRKAKRKVAKGTSAKEVEQEAPALSEVRIGSSTPNCHF